MKNTNTIIDFNAYVVTIKFNKEYFENSNESLTKKLKFVSTNNSTTKEIQRNYPNAKVINVEKIIIPQNYTITDFMSNYKIS